MPLTDLRVQMLTTCNRNERLVVDTNGLYLRLRKVRAGITRSWQYRRRDGGKLTIETIGTYPSMSLKEERLRAAELGARRDLVCGTVTEAAEQWLKERVHTHSAGLPPWKATSGAPCCPFLVPIVFAT